METQKHFNTLGVWLGKCKTILLSSELVGEVQKRFYYARGLVRGNKKQFFLPFVCSLRETKRTLLSEKFFSAKI